MTPPLYRHPSVDVARSADEVHRRLVAEPQMLAAAATAEVLHRGGPLLRRWGFVTTALPTVTATATTGVELGSIAVQWRGDETATGWPDTSARVLVTPTGPTGCRLTLATTRAPSVGVAADGVDRLHGQRGSSLATDGFLRALRQHVEADEPVRSGSIEPIGATP